MGFSVLLEPILRSGVGRVSKNGNASSCETLTLVLVLLVSIASYSQNQVLEEVQFVTKSKTEKTSGVWIDGQYVG